MRPRSKRSALLHLTGAVALVTGLAGCGGITTTASDGGGDARESRPCPDAGKLQFEAGAGACRGDKPLLVGGKDTGFSTCSGTAQGSPVLHRPAVTSCPNLLIETKVASCTDVSGTCKTAADCEDAGPVVACILDDCAIAGYCDCRAGCVEDSQCPAKGEFAPHSLCLCAAPIGECDDAYCTSDSQCGPGMLCATGAGNVHLPDGGGRVPHRRRLPAPVRRAGRLRERVHGPPKGTAHVRRRVPVPQGAVIFRRRRSTSFILSRGSRVPSDGFDGAGGARGPRARGCRG